MWLKNNTGLIERVKGLPMIMFPIGMKYAIRGRLKRHGARELFNDRNQDSQVLSGARKDWLNSLVFITN